MMIQIYVNMCCHFEESHLSLQDCTRMWFISNSNTTHIISRIQLKVGLCLMENGLLITNCRNKCKIKQHDIIALSNIKLLHGCGYTAKLLKNKFLFSLLKSSDYTEYSFSVFTITRLRMLCCCFCCRCWKHIPHVDGC